MNCTNQRRQFRKINLLIICILGFCSMSSRASAFRQCTDPAYAAWSFKREIIVTNTGDRATDAVIEVRLSGKEFDYSKAGAGGADLRFSLRSGAGASPGAGNLQGDETLQGDGLSYWIERWNDSGISRIWVKLPRLNAHGPTRLYMYYGNAGAPAVSNGQAAFLFFDDFKDGDYTKRWTNTSIGEVSERDGMLKLRETDGEDGIITAHFDLRGRMIVRTLYQRGGADQHWVRAGVGGWNHYLCFGDYTDFAGVGTNYVMLFDSASITNLKSKPLVKTANSVISDKWRQVSYWYDGHRVQGRQDDVTVTWPASGAEWSGKAPDAPFPLSLRTLDNDQWDNFAYITVSGYIAGDQTVALGREQPAERTPVTPSSR